MFDYIYKKNCFCIAANVTFDQAEMGVGEGYSGVLNLFHNIAEIIRSFSNNRSLDEVSYHLPADGST